MLFKMEFKMLVVFSPFFAVVSKNNFLLQIWSSFKLSFLRNNLYNKVKLLI